MPDRANVLTRSTWEDVKRNVMLVLVCLIGAAGALPFLVAIFRLLDLWGAWLNGRELHELAIRASLAVVFAGVILCVLILFYRLRNDDSSPSLTSGLAVMALGAAMAVATMLCARGALTAKPTSSGASASTSAALAAPLSRPSR